MIGKYYWAMGIKLHYLPYKETWQAKIEFFDDGFMQDECTEGEIRSRYFIEIGTAIDVVKNDAERIGIVWRGKNIYVDGDGNINQLPENWREIVKRQCERIGFDFLYSKK